MTPILVLFAHPALERSRVHRRLVEAGVTVALTTHRLDQRSDFPEAVHKAIQHGLGEDDALAALTTTPARLLGLA